MDDHTHGEDGRVIITPVEPLPEPVDPAPAVEAAATADVEIARINADGALALAKEETRREKSLADSRIAELEAENLALRDALAAAAPPAPEAVVVSAPDPEPEPEPAAPAPEPVEQPEEEQPKKSRGFFGPAYH